MRSPAPLPTQFRGRSFSVAEAVMAGMSRERLRRGDLASPFTGVRAPLDDRAMDLLADGSFTPQTPDDWVLVREAVLVRARAAQNRLPAGVVFSHATAAQILGLYLPAHIATDPLIHVVTESAETRPRTRGVRSHLAPINRLSTTEIDGLRTTTPLETWCMLAPQLTLDQTVIIADQLMERNHPLASKNELERAVHSHAGRHGAKKLRAALPLARARTDSPQETLLRLALGRANLPEPSINHPVVNRFGVQLRLGDLVYVKFRVLVEYDGWRHRDDSRQFERDIDVLQEAMDDGWRVVRVHKGMMGANAHVAVGLVRSALLDQGWRP